MTGGEAVGYRAWENGTAAQCQVPQEQSCTALHLVLRRIALHDGERQKRLIQDDIPFHPRGRSNCAIGGADLLPRQYNFPQGPQPQNESEFLTLWRGTPSFLLVSKQIRGGHGGPALAVWRSEIEVAWSGVPNRMFCGSSGCWNLRRGAACTVPSCRILTVLAALAPGFHIFT